MKQEQTTADVRIGYGEKIVGLKCLADTWTSRSLISKKLTDRLNAFTNEGLFSLGRLTIDVNELINNSGSIIPEENIVRWG